MMAGFGLHGAPHMGDIDENDPERASRSCCVRSFHHADWHVDFACANQSLFWGVPSRHHSVLSVLPFRRHHASFTVYERVCVVFECPI